MQICIFEDKYYSNFLPLVYFRPTFELRSGILSLRRKIESLFPGVKTSLLVRKELTELVKETYPHVDVDVLPETDCWFINGRLLADDRLSDVVRESPAGSRVFFGNDEIVAAHLAGADLARLTSAKPSQRFAPETFAGLPAEQCDFVLFKYPWELVQHTPEEIERDHLRLQKLDGIAKITAAGFPGVHFIEGNHIFAGKECSMKPGAVLDATSGPIVLGDRVTVMSNAVIEGPVFIGDNSLVKAGARVYHGTSLGVHCKVAGEIENSLMQSYSNKQHDGFLGHSYLGSWVNIGAGTNTSDLKNTYGTVKMQIGQSMVDTRSQFIGLIMGDHSKSGIGTMFNSGAVVGVSCNVFGAGFQPKFVPSFTWASPESLTEYNLEKSLETARTVMSRRNVEMSAAYEQVYRSIFRETDNERHTTGIA